MRNNLFKRMSGALIAGVMTFGLLSIPAGAAGSNQNVHIDLWNAVSNQASMGNVATDNNKKALYNPDENTLQIATNPVNVSGYQSAITAARYDTTGNGDYVDVEVLSTGIVQTGDKYDGTDHTVTYLSSFEIELPDYLTKDGVEFIPIQMTVPYTPMDVVVGTGYLNARLRIDWDQTEATGLNQIEPDTTMSSGQVAAVDVTDSATGIRMETDTAKVASDTQFQVRVLTSGTEYEKATSALGNAEFTLYEIKLVNGANELQPYGAVSLTFPYSGEVSMYRINDTGTKTVLRGTESDEGYEIMTSKLGLFAVFGGTKIDVKPSTSTGTNTGSGINSNAATAFTDISGHWAETYITRAVGEGLFSGTSTSTFSPDTSMTAGMVITVLYRMAGSPATTLPDSMENVAEGSWYEIACAWGYNNGIIGGYKAFYPEQAVSRQELATMLYNYDSLRESPSVSGDLSKFSDSGSVVSWAKDAMTWANAVGIVSGTSATTLAPESGASRAQVATMLCRYLDYAK